MLVKKRIIFLRETFLVSWCTTKQPTTKPLTNFFRRIRYHLLEKNKTGKYFKYAIGEIFLVVIGILIALQINNWNENRNILQDIEETKIALKKELEKNIVITSRFVSNGYILSNALKDVKANKEFNNLESTNSIYNEFWLFDTFVYEMTNDNLNEFISLEKSLSIRDKSFLKLAKELKDGMKERTIWEAKATDLSLQRIKEFSDELPWFYNKDSLSNKLRNDYIKNNPFFKNKAIHYLNFQLNENVFYASEIRNNALMLLWKLECIENKDIDLSVFLNKRGLRSFNQSECNSSTNIIPEYLGFRNMFVVYNHSSETKVFQLLNDNQQIIQNTTLETNEYINLQFGDNEYIQLDENCERIYTPVRNGFLILEER